MISNVSNVMMDTFFEVLPFLFIAMALMMFYGVLKARIPWL